ncbi:MAG: shikimate kinase, partial [Lachnospiraceae bacterium]|nr:shikimate kinase [Lachnospiraceae bacterium]
VVRPENEALLRQNGRIYYLKRPLEKLAVAGRPLSEQQSVQALYEKRRALYEAFADATVDNVTTIEDAAQTIVDLHFCKQR